MQADPVRLPYQELLRTIGQFVTERDGNEIALLELPNRFLLRYRGLDGNVVAVELRESELEQESETREGSRKQRGGSGASPADALRAVGAELERREAYTILLETVDDGYFVSYQYSAPTQGFALHKAVLFLSLDGVQEMSAAARESRKVSNFGLFRR